MAANRLTPFQRRTNSAHSNCHSRPDILGHEKIDLTRLKKQAQLTQSQIPKIPRITRTVSTLESVLKVLEDHSRASKAHIDQLIQSVEQENPQLARTLHESQVAYLKLQAHTASLQSLKECYCRYAHMLDGARTMFHAYQQTSTKGDSIEQVKLGLKECTQTLCAIEAQLESMLGTFALNLQEISGFSRICPGDEYELLVRYGQQKWKSRGRILKQHQKEQSWSKQEFQLKAKLADLLLIKLSEVKLLGVSLKTIGTKCFEVNNFYSIEPQRMIINANQSGTIKLMFLVQWHLYDQVDTKFTFYNPNRSYSDVTRTWSMFVGNSTLLRTVNDTLSTCSSKRLSTFDSNSSPEYLSSTAVEEEANHYDEIDFEEKKEASQEDTHSCSSFAAGFNSDEISSAVSNDYCHTEEEDEEDAYESIYELDLIIDQVRTSLDDLRLIDRPFAPIFDQLEQILTRLDEIIKTEIHQQTEKTLEIETVLGDFQFLNSYEDDQDTLKTIDSGFEGERQSKQFKSLMNLIFVDVLNRILVLLHFIQNRTQSDDQLLAAHLTEQYEQLQTAIAWCEKQVKDVKQALSEFPPATIDFWSACCSNETFTVPFERCRKEISLFFNCTADVSEYFLNNLCSLPFENHFQPPKEITLIQIWFLLKQDRAALSTASEQIALSQNLSELIATKDYSSIALMLNRRTLNNRAILDRLIDQYDFQLPPELIGQVHPSIREDFITQFRTALLSQPENPNKRLQIHKMIFNLQQLDSL